MIGIVGGMGPYAGLDLVQKIFDHTRAKTDQSHIPVSMISIPSLRSASPRIRFTSLPLSGTGSFPLGPTKLKTPKVFSTIYFVSLIKFSYGILRHNINCSH